MDTIDMGGTLPICYKPDCGQTLDLKRCGQCKAALYCSIVCQKLDLPEHKIWCKSAAQAQNCAKCTNTIKALKPAILLHVADKSPDANDPRFAWSTHAPFHGYGPAQIAHMAIHKTGNRNFSTVLMYNGSVYAGPEGMSASEIRRFFARRDEPCAICLEKQTIGPAWSSCPQCQSKICPPCTRTLEQSNKTYSKTYGLQCPVCRY